MDDDIDLASVLLSRFVGMLEDLAAIAVQASVASDPAAVTAIRDQLAAASRLLDAVVVLVLGRSSG